MSLSLSVLRAVAGGPSKNASDLFGSVSQELRAWPWWCDTLGHVNNARYLDLLGLGRLRWTLDNGLFRSAFRHRMSLLVAGVGGVYRHSIPRMAPFVLYTRLGAFDERWLCFEQTFVLATTDERQVAARFLVRCQLRSRRRALTPREALRQCGRELPDVSPLAPADLDAWLSAQDACLSAMRPASAENR